MSAALGRNAWRLASLGGGVVATGLALQDRRTASAAAAPQRLWCWGRLVPALESAPPAATDDQADEVPVPRLKERSPVDVSVWSAQGLRVEQMVYGAKYGAALDDRGGVWAWGAADGAGGATPKRLAPPPSGKYTSLASTDGSLYAVSSRGALLRWAGLGGAVGADAAAPAAGAAKPLTPTALGGSLGGVSVSAISAGAKHMLVTSRSGELYAFGDNEHGQLGLGEALVGLEPEQVV